MKSTAGGEVLRLLMVGPIRPRPCLSIFGCTASLAAWWQEAGEADLGCCFLAAKTHSLVQQLGHLLVVGMVLAPRSGLDEAVVLQLLHGLLWESLQPSKPHQYHATEAI